MTEISRLSSLDSFFLYHERKEWPLHIGLVSIFDGEIALEEVIRLIASRIDYVPRYRQRLIAESFNLAHPQWEFDPGFDVRNHIFEERLEPLDNEAGSEEGLSALAGRLLGEMLDRTKPLWDLRVVQGLTGGRTAFITRVHHCLVDGVAGVDLMKILFDLTRESTAAAPQQFNQPDKAETDPGQRVFEAVIGGLEEVVERAIDLQHGLLTMLKGLLDPQSRGAMLALGGEIPPLLTPVSLLPFNGPLSGERRFIWLRLPFAEARAMRSALHGSVNDVVLTVIGRAVSRYAVLHGQPITGRRVRVMAPVNLRQEDHRGKLGNAISLLPVEIPLDAGDPVGLFHQINRQTTIMKAGHMAEAINLLLSMYGTIPAPLQSAFGALMSTPIPPFNLIATNVPGPQIPLYAAGRRLVATYPYVPIAYAIGFGVAVMSYDQGLFIGLGADARAMPDVAIMRQLIVESFAELRQAALGNDCSYAT